MPLNFRYHTWFDAIVVRFARAIGIALQLEWQVVLNPIQYDQFQRTILNQNPLTSTRVLPTLLQSKLHEYYPAVFTQAMFHIGWSLYTVHLCGNAYVPADNLFSIIEDGEAMRWFVQLIRCCHARIQRDKGIKVFSRNNMLLLDQEMASAVQYFQARRTSLRRDENVSSELPHAGLEEPNFGKYDQSFLAAIRAAKIKGGPTTGAAPRRRRAATGLIAQLAAAEEAKEEEKASEHDVQVFNGNVKVYYQTLTSQLMDAKLGADWQLLFCVCQASDEVCVASQLLFSPPYVHLYTIDYLYQNCYDKLLPSKAIQQLYTTYRQYSLERDVILHTQDRLLLVASIAAHELFLQQSAIGTYRGTTLVYNLKQTRDNHLRRLFALIEA
jgi:hypothetical protein